MKKRYFLLALTLFSFNAAATDSSTIDAAIGGAIGGGLGAAVGNEVAGREGAIIGGALGAGVGAAVTTAEDEGHQNYRDRRHNDGRTYIDGRHTKHCPPGLAMQGRC
ncbi:hypothetical protein [Methylophaga lonarensis]|uniref:hypothetical protein n=1 Tax=Methylophaga lonarensis TaxID=999151 RepID=UPI003D288B2F